MGGTIPPDVSLVSWRELGEWEDWANYETLRRWFGNFTVVVQQQRRTWPALCHNLPTALDVR
jgi:hypothetical protein